MNDFDQRINRYKNEMTSLIREKNNDIERLRRHTERMESEDETPAPEVSFGTLTVVVTDEESMIPVNRANVLITFGDELASFLFTNDLGRASAKLQSDKTYTLTVAADGYNSATLDNINVTQDETSEISIPLTKSDLIYDNASLALMAGEAAINRFKEKECCAFPIRTGDSGDCVCALQKELATLSRVFDFTPPRPSGNFGQNTAAAVGKIQRLFALPVTYCVDEITWDTIFSAADALKMPSDDDEAKMCITFPKNQILSLGDQNDDVFFLQFALAKISNRFCNVPEICLNGIFDEVTQKSVFVLQNILSLPQTGRVGRGTMQAILKIL